MRRVVGHSLPQWNLVGASPPPENALSVSIGSHVVPVDQVVDFANSVDQLDIRLTSVSLRYAYYRGYLDHYRNLFRYQGESAERAGAGDLVIAIRLGDILSGWHAHYMPLPLSWYDELISQTGLNPIFVGEIGTDIYSEALKRRFPQARFVTHADPVIDFEFMRNSVHLAISVGSFSWLASWLSRTVRTVYFPIVGILNPLARPDVDLLPVDDTRYRFFYSGMQAWCASPAQLDHILYGQHDFREVGRNELHGLFRPHIGAFAGRGYSG
jgi:hypothetical protein